MTTHSADGIGTLIDSVKPIVSMERDGLVVIALGSATNADGPAYGSGGGSPGKTRPSTSQRPSVSV
jgi:hypothetical protein